MSQAALLIDDRDAVSEALRGVGSDSWDGVPHGDIDIRSPSAPSPFRRTAAVIVTEIATFNTPRTDKGARTRARLVKAAKEVFERDGFLDARISDIAKRAKVSYGAFYHYFDSKEQIFREVAQAQEERLTAPPDHPEEEDEHSSTYDRIRRANRRYFERYRSEAKLMGIIEQVSRYDPYVNAARMATQKHFAERSERALRYLQKDGQADQRLNPVIASDALGSMVARFAELWLTQGYRSYDFDEAVEQLTILWANAVGLAPE